MKSKTGQAWHLGKGGVMVWFVIAWDYISGIMEVLGMLLLYDVAF